MTQRLYIAWLHFISMKYSRQIGRDRNQINDCYKVGKGHNGKWLLNGSWFTFVEMNIFYNRRVTMVSQHCECSKWIVYFKMVRIVFYHNEEVRGGGYVLIAKVKTQGILKVYKKLSYDI